MYYQVIKNPISMDNIAKKLTLNQYETLEQFVSDMNLLFKNCSMFNAVCLKELNNFLNYKAF